MLNQRYTVTEHGSAYCRIALGARSKRFIVSRNFKCIVIVLKKDAYSNKDKSRVPIAFLNRFEKQLISYQSALSLQMKCEVRTIKEHVLDYFKIHTIEELSKLIPGYCDDTIPSLLAVLDNPNSQKNEKNIVTKTHDKLIDETGVAKNFPTPSKEAKGCHFRVAYSPIL